MSNSKTRVAVAVCLMAVVVSVSVAQTKRGTSKKKSSTKKSTKKAEITGRLPYYFGQLDLKDEQRTEIYKTQAKYEKQIADLEKELESVKGKRDREVEAVLTTTQKSKLRRLRSGTKKTTSSKGRSTSRAKKKSTRKK